MSAGALPASDTRGHHCVKHAKRSTGGVVSITAAPDGWRNNLPPLCGLLSMAEDRRQAKQAVLDRVNTALVLAGLNDTVWSIRDCDSTLFVLMYKKLVGKVSPP